jgi:hypothetical protein
VSANAPQPGPADPKGIRPSKDFRAEPWLPKAIVLVIALSAIAAGAGLLFAALGEPGYMAQSRIPLAIGVAGGLMFLLPGIAAFGFFLYGIGVPLGRAAGLLGLLLALSAVVSLLAMFHWGAFFGDPQSWSGTRIGPLGTRDLARIGAVWMDLLLLQFLALLLWLGIRQPKNLPDLLKALPRWSVHAFLFAPAALAIALYIIGTYDWVERKFGPSVRAATAPLAATPAKPKPAPPAKPLEYYLGTWVNPRMGQHESHKVEVRVEGVAVFIRAIQTCVPKDCVRGEGRAEVIRTADPAQIIELRAEFRNQKGRVSAISLVPEGETQLRSRETWQTDRGTYSGTLLLRRRQ